MRALWRWLIRTRTSDLPMEWVREAPMHYKEWWSA